MTLRVPHAAGRFGGGGTRKEKDSSATGGAWSGGRLRVSSSQPEGDQRMPSMDGTESLPAGDAAARLDASAVPAEAMAGDASSTNREGGIRTQPPAQQQQAQVAAAAGQVGETGDHPGLGALNRQLRQIVEQLETAHRVLGRVAAERDALRQQLADMKGVPVEDIVITSTGHDE